MHARRAPLLVVRCVSMLWLLALCLGQHQDATESPAPGKNLLESVFLEIYAPKLQQENLRASINQTNTSHPIPSHLNHPESTPANDTITHFSNVDATSIPTLNPLASLPQLILAKIALSATLEPNTRESTTVSVQSNQQKSESPVTALPNLPESTLTTFTVPNITPAELALLAVDQNIIPESVKSTTQRPGSVTPATAHSQQEAAQPIEPLTSADKMKLRLVIILLKHGDVDSAITEMDASESKTELAVEVVKGSYAESVALDDLAAFVARIEFTTSSAAALNALYEEMLQNEQLRTFETLVIHYRLKQFVLGEKSRTEVTALAEQVSPVVDEILASLVLDVSRNEFKRVDAAHQTSQKARLGEVLLSDIVVRYLDRSNKLPFKRLLSYFKRLMTRSSDLCQVLSVAWMELSDVGRGDGFDSLQIWLYAKYHVDDNDVQLSDRSGAKCKNIADSSAPAHREILMSRYNEYIRERSFSKLKALHEDYEIGMNVFATIVVECISKEQMHDRYFENLMDALDRLPDGGVKCWAVEALRKKLELFGMIGSPEHFRTLLSIRSLTRHSGFHHMHRRDVDRCNSAQKDMPRFFHKILYGDISNCRLINRYTKEPLYCASWWNENVDGSRGIYTWISKEEHPDQFWKISFTSRGLVHLQNNGRPHFYLARNSKLRFPYGAEKRSSFRLHAKRNKYILLENGRSPIHNKMDTLEYILANLNKNTSVTLAFIETWIDVRQKSNGNWNVDEDNKV